MFCDYESESIRMYEEEVAAQEMFAEEVLGYFNDDDFVLDWFDSNITEIDEEIQEYFRPGAFTAQDVRDFFGPDLTESIEDYLRR